MVAAFPGRLAVAISVADVHGDFRFDSIHQRVQSLYAPSQILGKSRIVGFIDLDEARAGFSDSFQLGIHDASKVHRKFFLARIVFVADAFRKRVRASYAEFCFPLGVCTQELEIIHEAKRSRREFAEHLAIVEVVVKLFGSMVYLHAREALGEIIDHVVTPQLSIGNDVDARHFLVLDGGFDSRVVDFVQVTAADAPRVEFGLEPLEPARHRVTANHGGRKNGKSHQHYSRCVV